MVGDVGQGDDIEAVVEKAYATGASKVIVEDLREEFLTGYVFPALKAGRFMSISICWERRWRVR
jgi:argininosuccinate synthase